MDHSKHIDDEKQSFKVGLSLFGEIEESNYKVKENTLVVQNGFDYRNFSFAKILTRPKPIDWFDGMIAKIIEDDAKPFVQGCVFSYGTHSMEKGMVLLGNESNEGIVYYVIRNLFERLATKSKKSVTVKCYELCRGKINDLFDLKKKVITREIKGCLHVQNLTEIEIADVHEVN